MVTGCVWLVCARGAGGGRRTLRVFCVPAWTAHLSSRGNPVNRGPRWTFGTESLAARSGPPSSSGALVCVRRPCRALLLPEGLPHLHGLQALLLGQPGSACLNLVFVSFLLVFRPLSSCSAPWKGSSGLFFTFATITLYIFESSLFCYVLSLGCNLYVCCDCLSYFPGC